MYNGSQAHNQVSWMGGPFFFEETVFGYFNPLMMISVYFGYKLKHLHRLPQTSYCGDLDHQKQVVSAVAS